jgi:hypothetical protein
LLFTTLLSLTAGAVALHFHNSLAIDNYLDSRKR